MAKQAGAGVREFSVRRQFRDGDAVCSIIDWRMAPVDGLMTAAELLTVRDGEIVTGELIHDPRALDAATPSGVVDLVERGYDTMIHLFAQLSAGERPPGACGVPAHRRRCVPRLRAHGAYCVAAHSTIALRVGVAEDVVEALRAGKPLPDNELEAVRRLTRSIVADRGWVGDEEIDVFLAAGYTRRNVLDIILGVGMKTLSNYNQPHRAHPAGPRLARPGMEPRATTRRAPVSFVR